MNSRAIYPTLPQFGLHELYNMGVYEQAHVLDEENFV